MRTHSTEQAESVFRVVTPKGTENAEAPERLCLFKNDVHLAEHHGGRSSRRIHDASPDSPSVVERDETSRLPRLCGKVVGHDLHQSRRLHSRHPSEVGFATVLLIGSPR